MTAVFYVGDAIEVMSKLPEKSVDLILTSPPFLALRSYLPADHPDKAKEGGSQSTPGEFIDWLLDVVEACDRVLAPHGSLCIELGDTYAGSGGAGGDYKPTGWRAGQEEFEGSSKHARQQKVDGWGPFRDDFKGGGPGGTGWPLAKSLSLIPESFRWAMVYGRNPHTGRTTEPWRLRNVIRWVRPNPPVGALGDKFRPATSELMVFCKSAKRYFDLDAVRGPLKYDYKPYDRAPDSKAASRAGKVGEGPRMDRAEYNPAGAPPLDWWNIPLLEGEQVGLKTQCEHGKFDRHTFYYDNGDVGTCRGGELLVEAKIPAKKPEKGVGMRRSTVVGGSGDRNREGRGEGQTNPLGAPPLDWWNIPPGGYEGAHYAVFPPELCVKPVKAMCPEKVCRQCGEPSRRIVEVGYVADNSGGTARSKRDGAEPEGNQRGIHHPDSPRLAVANKTLGFSDCGHDDWRPGLVLDPFAGSGTTLAVATGHGRDAIGIDLDARNFDLALERVGPFILERAS